MTFNPFAHLFAEADNKPAFDLPATDLDIQAAQDESGSGIPTQIQAYGGGIINVPHMGGPTIIDLAGLEIPASVPYLIDHKNEVAAQAGSGTSTTDGRTLMSIGTIARDSTAGKEVLAGHHGGSKFQASARTTPLKVERIAPGTALTINGRDLVAGVNGLTVVRKGRLREVTITPMGLDSETSVSIAASETNPPAADAVPPVETKEPAMPAETTPAENNQPAADVTASTPSGQIDIQAAITAGLAKGIEDIEARYERKYARRDALEKILGGNKDILATAIAEEWSDERAELESLKASMPRSPLANLPTTEGAPRDYEVIEAAVMLNAGSDGESLKPHFNDNTIEAAMSSRMRGFGLQALCHEAMRRAGKSWTAGQQFNDSAIRASFEADRDILAAGNSSYSLTGITNNAANKFALSGFMSVEQVWRRFCAIDSVNDFKEQSFYRLSAGTQYKELGVGEAIPMGNLGEESFTNSAKTHALMLSIPREVIINDDLGMVRTGARQNLGRGAGLTLAQTIFGKLLDSAAIGSDDFFHTSHADRGPNYKTGANSALSVESLQDAITMMRKQIDSKGDPIDVTPKYLLVGPELEFLANSICGDDYAPNPTATKRNPQRNPVQGMLEPLMSQYLNNAKVANGSATKFFVLADATALDMGALQVVFLQGRQTPVLESTDADFRTLGIEMRGVLDFDAKLQEKACAVQFAGA